MRALGASETEIRAARRRQDKARNAARVEIHDDCWPSVRLFAALGTQWRRAGLSGVAVGLDYAAIEPAARMLRIAMDDKRFEDLGVMERETLKHLARTQPETRTASARHRPAHQGKGRRSLRPRGGGRRRGR